MNLVTPVLLLAAVFVGEVLCSLQGPTARPVVLPSGYLADTREVAAAKSAHLASLAQSPHRPSPPTHVLHDGHIADTKEVAAAKAEHPSAYGGYHGADYSHSGIYTAGYDNYGASGSYNSYGYDATFHGPTAKPVVLHDGHIADTHEVAAAKAEHFAAVAKARAHEGYHGADYSHSGNYAASYDNYGASDFYNRYVYDATFQGPTKARPHGGDYRGHYAAGAPGHLYGVPAANGAYSFHYGGLAQPVVLPSGYLADTQEVARAKQQHFNLLLSSRTQGYKTY